MTTSRIIKGYELREQIGEGGFGEVWRADQTSIDRPVAIKFILPRFANHPDFIRRFEAEAQLIARLEHLHIVPLFDYWRDPDGAYLVMRYLRGGSLKKAIADGGLELSQVGQMINQITAALDRAHGQGVIHRDIKPSNIMLDEDENAYLSDFGIAKDLLGSADLDTQSGHLMASPPYAAPEQARSDPVSPRTDIYSLGVTLYEMLMGEHPFPNLSAVELFYKHLNEPLPELKNLPADVSDSINEVIQKATAKNPAHRYADALEMAAAFRQAANLDAHRSDSSLVEVLTQREQEILQLLIDNKSNKEIAAALVIAPSTVKWYNRQIFKKLGVNSRVQAIVRARELDLIVPSRDESHAIELTYIPTEDFQPENPYKGLRAFQAADNQDFFGREKITEKLIKRLNENDELSRFLAVVGPSGSGKSSLVKGRIDPAIWRGDLPNSEKWYIIDMIPGAYPFDELEVALMKVAANQSDNLHEQLTRDDRGLIRVGQLILPDDDTELLIVIDQFEEVFTLIEDEKVRTRFLDMLYKTVIDKRSRVRLVVTLRADFYDRPLQYPKFGELIRNRMETVLPLTAKELEQAIVKPAAKSGVTFEEGLVAHISDEVAYQPGALPLLQYALTELFEKRDGRVLTHTAYQAIGGAVGALAKRADDIYHEYDDAGQATIHQLFLRLVTLGEGTEDTRRRVARSELLSITHDEDLMDDIIDTYAAYRLLSLDHDPATRTPTVEVAHEAILREWERLRTWLNDGRDDVKMQRQLAALGTAWQTNNLDESYLVRGTRLEQFQWWSLDTQLSLTPIEMDFLSASIDAHEHREAEQQAQIDRETRLEHRARKVLQSLVAVFLVAAVIATGLALFAFGERSTAQTERDNAQVARDAAEREAEVSQSIALAGNAQEALTNGDHDLAVILALEANAIDDPPNEARQALSRAIYAPGTRLVLEGHQGPVAAVDFSPDGRYAISGGGKRWSYEISVDNRDIVYNPQDYSLRLWNLETGQEERQFLGHTDAVWDVDFSPDGTQVISASSDKTLIVWDVEKGTVIHTLTGHVQKVRAVKYSPDGLTAVSVGTDGFLVWDIETGTALHHFYREDTTLKPWDFDISADGRYGLVGMRQLDGARTSQGAAILVDLETGEWIQQITTDGPVYVATFSPDGTKALISAHSQPLGTFNLGTGRPILMYVDLETGHEIARFFHTGSFVTGVEFSPDGELAIATTFSQNVFIWNLRTRENLMRIDGHNDWVVGMALNADGNQLLTTSEDGTVRLWDLWNGAEEMRLDATSSSVISIDISHEGRMAVSGTLDRKLTLWDLETGDIIRNMVGYTSGISAVAFSPDGRQIATASSGFIRIWDVDDGHEIATFLTPMTVSDIQFTRDGRFLFTSEQTTSPTPSTLRLQLWDVQTGDVVRQYFGHTLYVAGNDISLDGRYGFSTSNDGTMRMWDLATGEEVRRFESNRGNIWQVAISPDGRTALTSSEDTTLIQWDIESGNAIRLFEGHSQIVFGIDISPDGKWAISSGADRNIILWDMETGHEIRRFDGGHQNGRVVFAPDSRFALSTGGDGKIIMWRLTDTDEEIIAWAYENRYVREFTCLERERFNITPLCENVSDEPPTTRTRYPTLTASTIPSATPTIDATHFTPSATWTPIPSYTPTVTNTPAPSSTPNTYGELVPGVLSRGNLTPSGSTGCLGNTWTYSGMERQSIKLNYSAINLSITVIDPSGNTLAETEDARIGPVELPETGTYQVIVQAGSMNTCGTYTLTLTVE